MNQESKILLQGELTLHPVPVLLNYLYDQRETGRLVMVQEGVNKTIYIIEGKPVNVDSSLRDETLGRYLVKLGKISEEAYQKSLELMMNEGIQQGAALVKLGLLGPKELYRVVKDQSIQKLLTAFSFREGQYRFYQETAFVEKIYRFEFPFQLALKQGVYQYFPETCLEQELAKAGSEPIALLPGFQGRLAVFELDEQEKDFVPLIDGYKNREALAGLESEYPFARRLLYLFLLCGIAGPGQKLADSLRAVGAGEKTEARVEMFMPTEGSPEVTEEPEPEVQIKDSPDKILEFYIQLKSRNYLELLGLKPDTDDEQVENAYHELLREFGRDRFPSRMEPEIEAKLEEINTDIIKAYEALRSQERRARYLAGLKAKEEKPRPQTYLHAENFLQEGMKYVRNRDYVNAQKMFEKAVELSPNEPEYYAYLGWTIYCNPELDREEKTQKAKDKISQAIKMNPNMDSGHVFLGKILKEQGDEQAAVREFKLAVKCNPNCREALRELESRGIKP